MRSFAITSLGCARNLVDSEIIVGSLKEAGLRFLDVDDNPDLLVINTCAFIRSAREEAIDAILEAAALKNDGKVKRIVVCGCLPQLYKGKLLKELVDIDLIVGTSDFPRIGEYITELDKRHAHVSPRPAYIYGAGDTKRVLMTPRHYAYVKISEGCDNVCSYCIIRRLRGHFRSRTIESVLDEIRELSSSGKPREINLIGQDTTAFGMDRARKCEFPELLRRICALKESPRWVRILYTHPAHYSDELIETVRDEDKICKYLDLPVQHASDKILKMMNRRTTKKEIMGLIGRIRKAVPGAALRTSIIVGFPGETDEDFKELLEFLKDSRFERLGAFIYSREGSTPAARFKGHIPEKIKKERFDELMKLQQGVASDINRPLLGGVQEVLIDERIEGESDQFILRRRQNRGLQAADKDAPLRITPSKYPGLSGRGCVEGFIGRTASDAPEVDGTVYVSGKDLKVGEFYQVKIVDTLEYDLVGEAVG